MIENKAFWGLIGVVVGFFLNVAHSYIMKRFHICQLKRALRDECRSLLTQIPQLIAIFKQCTDNLSKGRVLPGTAVHSLSTVYRSTISEIYPYLSLKERNLLHVVYERLRVGDEILENYVSILSRELQENLINDPIQGWIIRMKEQVESYGIITNLLKSYLRLEPIDVFNIDNQRLFN
ncbi:MAG: hypothetical protein FJ121_02935 [Deltaproteobacteria bacterium]|nr:hypothetical protein [Deltaproteobacteria bacterium]